MHYTFIINFAWFFNKKSNKFINNCVFNKIMKIDIKDKKILALLDRNARISITQIAKKARLNKDVVRYRINNLEKSKIITSYYTIISANRLGYAAYRIYFDFINLNPELEKKLIIYLNKKFKAGQI